MSVNWYFQHTHFLTTSTFIYEVSYVLSLKLPNVFSILETFKCTFKSKVANFWVVQSANLCDLTFVWFGWCRNCWALFRATFHSSSFTVKWNSGILAGAAGNSLLKISFNSLHNVRNRCCRSLSPDIWISDKTSVVDGEGNHGLNLSVLSWSISSSSGAEPPRMSWASTVSEASKLRMTGPHDDHQRATETSFWTYRCFG